MTAGLDEPEGTLSCHYQPQICKGKFLRQNSRTDVYYLLLPPSMSLDIVINFA